MFRGFAHPAKKIQLAPKIPFRLQQRFFSCVENSLHRPMNYRRTVETTSLFVLAKWLSNAAVIYAADGEPRVWEWVYQGVR